MDVSKEEIISAVAQQTSKEASEFGKTAEKNTPRFSSSDIWKACEAQEEGDAQITIELLRNRYLYDKSSNKWYRWNGFYWVEDTLEQVMADLNETIDVYAQEAILLAQNKAKAAQQGKTEKQNELAIKEKAYLKRIKELRRLKRKQNVLCLATVGHNSLSILGDGWDSKPFLLGCPNGTIELESGNFRDGCQEDSIKTITNTQWKGINEPAEKWIIFLNDITGDDEDLVEYFKRLFGCAIIGKVIEHVLPVFFGANGRNGKSVLLEILHFVLGPLASPVQAEILLSQSRTRSSSGPSPEIVGLRGKRLVWASETGKGRALDAARIKWLTGGDTLIGREPFGKKEIIFEPTHTPFLLTNHKPQASSDDNALWSRIHLIPFAYEFVDNPVGSKQKKRDPHIKERLKQEAPGILAWLARGCLEYQKYGLNPPEKVKFATEEYRLDEDIIGNFIGNCCIDSGEEQASQLYKAYKAWARDCGYRAMNNKNFGTAMKKRVEHYKDRTKTTYYTGLSLKPEWEIKANDE
jgi:putative DNA primase/helicase